MIPIRAAFLLLFAAYLSPAWSQNAQLLPDAPVSGQDSGTLTAYASADGRYVPSKWFGVVDPDEKVAPLGARSKMVFWLHEEADPAGWFPVVASAGYEQLLNKDPKYGSDSVAFGERVGAGALRVTSYRFFSDSLLPTLTHEDPRYFRKAYGSPVARGLSAIEQVAVTRRDDGSEGVNYSDIVGHLAGAALTTTYYPAPSVSGREVMKTWGISLAGEVSGNLFLEFWPDMRYYLAHRHWYKPGQE